MKLKLHKADPKEQIQRDEVTFEGWGQKLSLQQYMKRESTLRSHSWGYGKSVETWLLKNDQGDILSSCETYPIVADQVWGVGSVFTEPKWRGMGFATQLLRELNALLTAFRQSRPSAVILFSEVGERIYERAGFRAVESNEWVIDVDQCSPELCLDHTGMKLEYISDLSEISGYSQGLVIDQDRFWIHPSLAQLRWHHLRESIYGDFFNQGVSSVYGVKSSRSYLVWTLDYKLDSLRILASRFFDGVEQRSLLSQAITFAQAKGMPQVRIWDSEQVFRDRFCTDLGFASRCVRREDSIAMIHILSPDLLKGHWVNLQRGLWM
ncbi:hypothetical protein EBS43_06055 [bacterium]|jgi:GNAT superfamily N-acetyltransferase|nr:hypothetical protein [bacterium]